ncbi:hypothetical protein ISF_00092 [Cordyceps fumosorosea ARSEF 2679]|uniref:NAD kinase associated with ferric reductase n=1 Tax=Cordyceps fumosorosea (strain ARSEF 2679) TaxID=1081104 RepID=A0A168DZK8_CORFA|nr:hypothetical protein ISF_00092 [Cordyceps fumosorosea ARSEF 2679]OAA73191.1 hypothetical protein ISF_00092 [Cordyceps fumosorosea ARSEF 2679]
MAPQITSPLSPTKDSLDSPTLHPALWSPTGTSGGSGSGSGSGNSDHRPVSSSSASATPSHHHQHPSFFINTSKATAAAALCYEPRAKTPLSAVSIMGSAAAATEQDTEVKPTTTPAAETTALTPSPSPTWGGAASNTTTTTTTTSTTSTIAAASSAALISDEDISPRTAAFPHSSPTPTTTTTPTRNTGTTISGRRDKLPGARFTPKPLMLRQSPPPSSQAPSAAAEDISALGRPKPDDAAAALSLNSMLSSPSSIAASMHGTLPNPPLSAASLQLADALQNLAAARSTTTTATIAASNHRRRSSTTTATTALAALRSPCFYHQRFDDAVDIDRVLEEIRGDEPSSMSHSRLVQTATSVREVSKQLRRRPVRRAVRSVMIVTKARDNQLVHLTRELAAWLLRTPRYGSSRGVCVYVDAKLRSSRRFDAPGLIDGDPALADMLRYWTPDLCWGRPEAFDLVLTLGGDGTVLFTSWLFQRIVPPVLSFSLGSLGFMTTFEFDRYRAHLDRVMGDDGMKINLRMRFTCTVFRHDAPTANPVEQFEVLNELVIDRGPSPYVSNLELYGDDELLTVVQADGCIFSTPTGSTAYSLSAGGSLVHPDIPAILLTPICPHTLSFRPMVLADTMALRVAVPRASRATAYCAFDGKGRVELRQGDHVTIAASQYPFPTVTRTDTEWFDSVSRTLRWNTRAAAQKPFEGEGEGEGKEDEDEAWDIDTDSAYYASEEGSVSTSPIRRQMSMLGL